MKRRKKKALSEIEYSYESLQEFQTAFEDQFMRINGIVGMGIHYNDDDTYYVVYTNKRNKKIVFNDIMDVPVVVEYIGDCGIDE